MRPSPVLPEAAASAKHLRLARLNNQTASVSSEEEEDSHYSNLQLEVRGRMCT